MAEDLSDLTREELNERAEEAGVEDPEDLPNKEAVIDAINEAEGTSDSDAEGDTEEGEVPEEEKDEVLTTSDPDSRVEGVTPGDVEPDPPTETHASDAADYPFPPAGDVDAGKLSDDRLEGESEPIIQPDSRVRLGDTENVPEELQGHPALVISINDEDEEPVFEVRTRDEHNSTLYLEREDFAEVHPGSVGVRGFGV